MTNTTQQMAEAEAEPEKILIGAVGGEALMEGIMMRGPKGAAVALRLPDGSIETEIKQTKLPSERFKPLGWPLLRGPVSFIYSMVFGYKCMMEAAEKTTLGELEAGEGEELSKLDRWIEEHLGDKLMAIVGVLGTVLGVALALGLFVYAPKLLFDLIDKNAPGDLTRFAPLIQGGVRVLLFVGYMFVMSLIKDIRRVFQYHGAEHKSIFCYESGLPLTVENVRSQSRLHPRCGTSFLFLMILLSILLSSAVVMLFPVLESDKSFQMRLIWTAVKLVQFPVIMSLGYEFIRFAGRHLTNPLVRIISCPGLLMQRITTKEPSDDIIEVGIEALKAALGKPYQAKIPAKQEEEDEAEPTP
ncbi:MAG: DUF1385 domain-containing protein [Oscillospiraceae bacterium]|nr:DUF1385 domain-containing protein [Oscillospiraceae bacterium]